MKHFTIIISLVFSLTSTLFGSETVPAAKKGVLDLRDHDKHITALSLQGEWEFFWEELISPENFSNKDLQATIYGQVPAYWTQYIDSIPGISGQGYGTYRLTILLPENFRDTLAFSIPVFDSSFEIYINKIRIGGNGIVGRDKSSSAPEYAPFIYDFPVKTDSLVLVIHVSNFHHRRGGFWKNITIGDPECTHLKIERSKILTQASAGILFFFSFFFLIIALMGKRDKSMLWFSITVFGIFMRSIATVYFTISTLFHIPWEWIIRIEYLGSYLALVFGSLYFNSLFPSKQMMKVTRINAWLFAAIAILVIAFPVPVFAYSIYIFNAMVLIVLGYYMIISFIGVMKKKRTETIFFFSFLFFFGSVINDMLLASSSEGLSYNYFSPIAFQIFILSQALLLMNQWVMDYRDKIALSNELEYINRNLEELISDRTSELNNKNARLASTLQLKNKLFSIIAHDLKSPVASLAQYSDLLLKDKETRHDENVMNSLNHLAYSTVDLIDNLLYWGMSQKKDIQYHPEEKQLSGIFDNVLILFEHNLKNKRLSLTTDIPENLWAWCDTTLVKIILRNLISNAIKFSNEGGKIDIRARQENNLIEVIVEDEGAGMKMEQIDRLFKNKTMDSTRGTANEKGTGLGLSLVMDLIEINLGTIDIESKPGKGTKILFTLPGNHEI